MREKEEEDEWENFEEIVDVDEEDDEIEEEMKTKKKKMKKDEKKDEEKDEEEEDYPEDYEEYAELVAPPIIDGILPAPPSNWYSQRTRIDMTQNPPRMSVDLVSEDNSPFFEYYDSVELHEYFLGDKNFIE